MFYTIISFILLFTLVLIRIYSAKKFRKYILKTIFILQNIDIDSYYDEYFLVEIEKGRYDIEDNYDELFGNEIKKYMNDIPSIWDLLFSIKKYDIKHWMDSEFTIRHNIFVKDNFEFLYSKYKTQVYIAQMFLINKL